MIQSEKEKKKSVFAFGPLAVMIYSCFVLDANVFELSQYQYLALGWKFVRIS